MTEYDSLPDNVKKILNTSDENKDPYYECERLLNELKLIGWTFEYGLDGIPYSLKTL